jgi:hypothetical protein
MSLALSVFVRPSRAYRHSLVAGGVAHCAAAFLIAIDHAHYLGAPALAAAPGLAAAFLFGSAARRLKTHQIDISGTGDVRVTVQQGVGLPDAAAGCAGGGEPGRLLPGGVVWPLLMILRYGGQDGAARTLIVWRDALDSASWRALAVALIAIGRRGGTGRVHEKIR